MALPQAADMHMVVLSRSLVVAQQVSPCPNKVHTN